MSFVSAELAQFVAWACTFDPYTLQREADVEEDFVKPLFRLLGYSDTYLREKYPLKGYNPGKSGRKPETDIIYFSTEEKDKQDSDTSLLLIEAKEPNEIDLEKDIDQATFYSDHLKPLFYAVTNSHRLIIFQGKVQMNVTLFCSHEATRVKPDGLSLNLAQRYRYHKDERIFDNPVSDLQKIEIVTRLFRSLHFNVVKTLKEQAVNEHTHELYTELNLALSHKPDLLTQIAKGDYISSEVHEGRRLVVSRPKVAIDCKLPLVLRGGSCRIEFSNIMLRGLTCELTHEDIVRDLLTGLQTSPHWHTRRFFQKTSSNDIFEAHLGQTIVLLSKQEAEELCKCIDIVGSACREALIKATDLLEAWNYMFVKTEDYQGFSLLSVKPWLWVLMKRFAIESDIVNGKSDWRVFDARLGVIYTTYNTNMIAASLLKEYYVIFTEIAKSIEPSSVDIGYIQTKLGGAERNMNKFFGKKLNNEEEKQIFKELSSYDGILHCLERHMERIQQIEYENKGVAELLSRVYITIADGGSSYIQQKLLNRPIEAIQPLWEQSRFESRYVRPLFKSFFD